MLCFSYALAHRRTAIGFSAQPCCNRSPCLTKPHSAQRLLDLRMCLVT